jgi:hypothetical protein
MWQNLAGLGLAVLQCLTPSPAPNLLRAWMAASGWRIQPLTGSAWISWDTPCLIQFSASLMSKMVWSVILSVVGEWGRMFHDLIYSHFQDTNCIEGKAKFIPHIFTVWNSVSWRWVNADLLHSCDTRERSVALRSPPGSPSCQQVASRCFLSPLPNLPFNSIPLPPQHPWQTLVTRMDAVTYMKKSPCDKWSFQKDKKERRKQVFIVSGRLQVVRFLS